MGQGQELEITEETTEVVEAEETEATESKGESAYESARRAIEELTKGKEPDAEPPAKEETQAETEEAPEQATDRATEAEPEKAKAEESIEPPTRWTVEAKEWFLKQPKEYQREISRQNKEFESHTTKLWQEINRQKSRYDGIDQIIRKYGEEWNLKGVADVAAIAELAATEQAMRKDPEGTIARLIKAFRINPEKLLGKVSGKDVVDPHASTNNFENPEVAALRQKLEELQNWKQGLESQNQSQIVESVAAEIKAVQNQMDGNGRYVYPELHDPNFLERVKPFVTAAKEAQPGISWGEATKRGYAALQSISGSPSLQPAKLPSQGPNTNRNRARLVSVAGQSTGSGSTQSLNLDDVKVPKSSNDTVRLVMQMLKRG